MGIVIQNPFTVQTPQLLDDRTRFETVAVALQALSTVRRAVGLTILITSEKKEYWFRDGIEDSDFIPKESLPSLDNTLLMSAAEPINGHRFVAANTENKIILADWTSPRAIGLITQAVDVGDQTPVILSGKVTHSGWNFDMDKPILLGENGQPVQTATETMPLVRVGFVLSPTSMLLRIESPVFST